MSSEADIIRRRQADFADRIGSIRDCPEAGAASLVGTLQAVATGSGPRFFDVVISTAYNSTDPAEPAAGDAGSFNDDAAVFQALSLLGGPSSLTNPHVLMTQVDGIWCFEAT